MRTSKAAGFTLPELIVVVGVVSVLLVVALIFMHPKDTSVLERNAQRQLDTAHLMQTLARYTADHGGLPAGITEKNQVIGTQDGELDLCDSFVPAYLKDMPNDPVTGGVLALTGKICTSEDVYYSTGYTISRAADGAVTIAAPDAEDGKQIKVTRTF